MRRLPGTVTTARAFAAAALLSTAAAAQEVGDPGTGRRLAREWCAACHLVERSAPRASDFAPPFAEIARDPRTTDFRLRAFLRTPHQRMPNFQLSRDETDDLIAYILTLRRP